MSLPFSGLHLEWGEFPPPPSPCRGQRSVNHKVVHLCKGCLLWCEDERQGEEFAVTGDRHLNEERTDMGTSKDNKVQKQQGGKAGRQQSRGRVQGITASCLAGPKPPSLGRDGEAGWSLALRGRKCQAEQSRPDSEDRSWGALEGTQYLTGRPLRCWGTGPPRTLTQNVGSWGRESGCLDICTYPICSSSLVTVLTSWET